MNSWLNKVTLISHGQQLGELTTRSAGRQHKFFLLQQVMVFQWQAMIVMNETYAEKCKGRWQE